MPCSERALSSAFTEIYNLASSYYFHLFKLMFLTLNKIFGRKEIQIKGVCTLLLKIVFVIYSYNTRQKPSLNMINILSSDWCPLNVILHFTLSGIKFDPFPIIAIWRIEVKGDECFKAVAKRSKLG